MDGMIMSPSHSVFFRAPVDLRLKIYNLVFSGSLFTFFEDDRWSAAEEKLETRLYFASSHHRNLLLTCRAIYNEALPTYWSETFLDGKGTKLTQDTCQKLPPLAKTYVKHLRNIRLTTENVTFRNNAGGAGGAGGAGDAGDRDETRRLDETDIDDQKDGNDLPSGLVKTATKPATMSAMILGQFKKLETCWLAHIRTKTRALDPWLPPLDWTGPVLGDSKLADVGNVKRTASTFLASNLGLDETFTEKIAFLGKLYVNFHEDSGNVVEYVSTSLSALASSIRKLTQSMVFSGPFLKSGHGNEVHCALSIRSRHRRRLLSRHWQC